MSSTDWARGGGRRFMRLLGALYFPCALGGCAFLPPGLLPGIRTPPEPVVPEPSQCGNVGDRPLVPVPEKPLLGAADFHNHQFSNLGFGGRLVWGQAFDENGIEAALSSCGADGLCWDEREVEVCRFFCGAASEPNACRRACERSKCTDSPPHGHLGTQDPVGAALGQGYGHQVSGYPHFVGWPNYNSYTHQQAYHRWLRRAFDGGLRLMVMLAVTNEVLCDFIGHEHACDDMTNVNLQLEEARKLERYIDQQDDCVLNHSGWYRIAKNPAHARSIIASGAMAVVLGIEVDSLFDCKRGRCSAEMVRAEAKRYKDQRVHHVFPIHLFDNDFGGAAATNDYFNFGNAVVNQRLLAVENCSPTYAFRFNRSDQANDLIASMAAHFGLPFPEYPNEEAHCNARGLRVEHGRTLGEDAIKELMKARMIIDVDHMSAKARAKVFELAKKCHYPGLVSGHSGFTAIVGGQEKHEGQLTPTEVSELLKLGGLLAPILHQGGRAEIHQYPRRGGNPVAADCSNSAKSFAQAYLYAVDHAAAHGIDAVGFGSDINGLAGLPAPRFGQYACEGDGAPQSGKVRYPFTPVYDELRGTPNAPQMARSQIGNRVFDINFDGFAHMGMFPDFVEELSRLRLTNDDLAPLFRSAEAYIDLWERLEAATLTCELDLELAKTLEVPRK